LSVITVLIVIKAINDDDDNNQRRHGIWLVGRRLFLNLLHTNETFDLPSSCNPTLNGHGKLFIYVAM
jgi:hypothetical protein